MSDEIRCLWDCRAQAGQYCELILVDSRQTANVLKGFRNPDCQAVTDVRISHAPRDESELRNDEQATTLVMVVKPGDRLRYEKVIILRRDDAEEISEIISTVKRFFLELLEQRRLFVTDLRASLDLNEFHRALGAARIVSIE